MSPKRLAARLPIAVAAFVLTQGAFAQSAPPKTGEADVVHVFTFHDRQVLKMGDRTVIHRELVGVSLNNQGSGMFHNLGIRCIAMIDIEQGRPHSQGRCVEVDAQGDQIFHTFENKAGKGAHQLVGGTGKFQGITGQQDFAGITMPKSPEGTTVMVVPVKAKWKLP
jgi:hypothetical protein